VRQFLPAMPKPRLIGPPPRSTPAGFTSPGGHRRELPDDLLRDASRRVGIMSLVAASLWAFGTVLYHIAVYQTDTQWIAWQSSDAIALVSVLVAIALFVYTRVGNGDPRFILDLGLVLMVFMSLGAGLIMHWDPVAGGRSAMPAISWLGAIVLMSAAVVPSTPMKMLVAGLISVSMNPLGMLIARERGVWDFGPISNVLVMHYQDYLLVGVAVVISRLVARLGQEVAKAREMGSYQLGDLLGRGGMGEVYKATHRMLARPAAIKLIRPEMIGPGASANAQTAITRFRREATSAANLRSPHTVELYDFGVTDDGTMYFAMELLDGLDLESLVRQKGPLPAARVVHILRQACESLQEAHVAGLVHRDIKPANIHLGRLALRDDFVKVLDFGLVKSVVETDLTQSHATAFGMTPGTPAYMAPEMALGQSVDGRTDLYALGCVAYFLLTGRLVFEGTDGLQMIVRRLHEDPVPPSTRAELPVPAELDRLVLACLARQPEHRPQSAADLGRALTAIPGPSWSDEQATQWWQTNRP
jgi:hypothetical protein